MSDINLRIKEIVRLFADGNNSAFAKLVNVSEANVRNYINGTEPKAKFLESIIDNIEINAEWLLTGKGNIKREEKEKKTDGIGFETKPIGEQLNSLNEKLEYLIKSDALNRVYLKTIMVHLDITLENFKPVEEDLEKNKKTASN